MTPIYKSLLTPEVLHLFGVIEAELRSNVIGHYTINTLQRTYAEFNMSMLGGCCGVGVISNVCKIHGSAELQLTLSTLWQLAEEVARIHCYSMVVATQAYSHHYAENLQQTDDSTLLARGWVHVSTVLNKNSGNQVKLFTKIL